MSAPHATGDRLLVPGTTCWRVERAERFSFIVDAADYFRHTKAAMLRAKHRIVLIGWDFDSRTIFEPNGKTLPGYNQLGPFMRSLVRRRPGLEVFVLRSNLKLLPAFEGLWEGVTPVSVMNQFSSERLHFAIDGAHPTGAVHHQKIVVVDDAVAFCGGIDFTVDRWDTPEHLDQNRFRKALGEPHGPRHEVAAAVKGPAARALGDVARDRWLAATGQVLEPVEATRDVWPGGLTPTLRDVDVAVARTMPRLGDGAEVREVEALNLAGMAAARETIYLENQYLASRTLVDALAARLREPAGPEIVIVIPRKSESPLEERSMDSARYRMLHRLWAADSYDRLGVYWPVTDGGTPVYVHAKVMAVDDLLFRVGSSNLNNRSLGFDSECDVAFESPVDARDSDDDPVAATIVALRDALVCEHLGVTVEDFTRERTERGSFLAAVEALRGEGRTLLRFTPETVVGERSLWAENDLMDPDRVPESFARSVARWLGGFVD